MSGRLFVRYWLVIAGLLTSILLVGGGLEIALAYHENLARIDAVQKAEVRLVAGRINQALSDLEKIVHDTASLPWQPQLLGLEDARQEFHRLLKVSTRISEMRALDAAGHLVLRVSRVQPDQLVQSPGGIASSTSLPAQETYLPIRYRNGSEPFTTLRLPVVGSASVFGSVEADLNLKFVSDVIREASQAQGRNVYVLDGEDNLIAHTDPGLPLKRLSFSSLAHVATARAGTGAAPPLVGGRSRDHLGRAVVVSGIPIGSSRWMVFVEEPEENVTRDAWATARRTALMILAGMLAAVLASYLFARRLTRPIVELRKGAERMGRGDLAARIEVKTGDEVEALSVEFNRMAAQLQEYTLGLERKVNEKTAELQVADRNKTALLKQVEHERGAAQMALGVAQEAMRARSLFLAAASHDLRQPLYAISILADALAANDLGEPAARALQKQREAIGILRELFDNLLDLSRLESGDMKPVIREISLVDTLRPLVAQYQALCESKGLMLECDVVDARVRTDPALLGRVVGNLLQNATRYTDAGTVTLRARQVGDRIAIEISDTGVGIAPDDQQKVFEEFVQLRNAARNRDKGVGLGLSIVKRVSDLLDMRLDLESQPGRGTRVSLSIPRADEARQEPQHLAGPGPTLAGFSGMRLWIVEDDRLVREALSIQLDAWSVDHDFALDRRELQSLLESDGSWPDAVLLDDMLGEGEQGLQLALWLRAFIPAERLALTTANPEAERMAALERSGIRVLRKPVAAQELAQWLEEAAHHPRPSPEHPERAQS